MMQVPSLELSLIALRALALVGSLLLFAWAFVRWRRAAQRDTQRLFEQMDMITCELNTVAQSVQAISERVESLAGRVESESRFAPVASAVGQRGYEVAARLAKNGATREELVTNCGISRHEAELLIRLHAGAAAATSSIVENLSSTSSNVGGVSSVEATPVSKARSRLSVVG